MHHYPSLGRKSLVYLALILMIGLFAGLASGAAKKSTRTSSSAKKTAVKKTAAKKTPTKRRVRRYVSPWKTPTYADSAVNDDSTGEDPVVRQAALEALGRLNGSVVVVDPNTGRILSMVNQQLALAGAYQPCSTIKIPVALAALSERVVDKETKVRLYGRTRMDMTEAIARSNNPYFARLGEELGYERFSFYAQLFGLGEKAGLDIPGESAGHFPPQPPRNGGMGMLTSFGEEIAVTPLQLAALLTSVANGGTLYYLQYPRSGEALDNFIPRIKRRLDIERLVPEVMPGMAGAVQYGTARRIQGITDNPIVGKTGTCTDRDAHLGWFGSFNDVGPNKLVVVVLLTGGKPAVGPAAAGVAGAVYKKLAESQYFAKSRPVSPAAAFASSHIWNND